ncbi:hypothetical protein MMC21_005432 [Puttea exsequens]|nr:hypothetical protein [Puttea exsequens]
MGNDGGSIPTRRELVKSAAQALSTTSVKEIQTEQQEHFWSTCALSHEPLAQPVVSDAGGWLYRKDAVVEKLLSASKKGEEKADKSGFEERVKGLKDIVEVRFETQSDTGGASKQTWMCPATGKALGPGTKAVYFVPCGHAFAESAIKEMPGENCLKCGEVYKARDVIIILPMSIAEKERLENRLKQLRETGLTHSLKKASGGKKKRKTATVDDALTENGAVNVAEKTGKAESNIKNQDTASLTAKVLKEQEERNKKRKMAANGNVESLFSKGNGMAENHVDFMTRGFSISAGAKR